MQAIANSALNRVRHSGAHLTEQVRRAFIVMAVVGFAGCGIASNHDSSSSPEGFEPGKWVSNSGDVFVEVRSDGTGEFVNLPWWNGNAFDCSIGEAEPVSDTFIWNYSEELDMVLFSADNLSIATTFEAGGVGGDDWNVLLYFVCMPDLPGWVSLDRQE